MSAIARTLTVLLAMWALGAPPSHAYVDIELDSGSHVKGESYSSEGGKLVVYRPSGAMEIDRSTVRSIREIEGSSSYDTPASPPSPPAVPPAAGRVAEPPPAAKTETKDPQERERELSHQLINMRLNRLAASQRGDQETMKTLDKEIGSLQKERIENYKKVDPSFDPESTKQ